MSSDGAEIRHNDSAANGMDTTEQETSITNGDDLQTPRSEENEVSRASSSSSSGSSVAVNCQSVPTIDIRLRFKPAPPNPSRRRSTTSTSNESTVPTRRLSLLTTIAQPTDDVRQELMPTPLSQEVSSEQHDARCQQPFNYTAPSDTERVNEVTAIQRQIQNGVALISTRMEGLIEINGQLRMELDNEVRKCQTLRDTMAAIEERWQTAERENFELKQRLESKEREAIQFARQAEELWQEKVKLEENFVEFKRNKDSEIGDLKTMLDARNREIKKLEVELRNRKQPNREEDNKKREETVETLAKIKALEETICSLRKDNATVSALARKLEADVESWRQKYNVSCHKLEIQRQRFDALKNDYIQLQDETQRLAKAQDRVLREPQQAFSASVIDLSEQSKSLTSSRSLSYQANRFSAASSGSKISNHRKFSHIRRASSRDSEHSSYSLPPVPGSVRRFFLE